MLSKRSQIQKVTCCMIPFTRHSGKGKSIGTKNRSEAVRGWEEEKVLMIKPQEGNTDGNIQ